MKNILFSASTAFIFLLSCLVCNTGFELLEIGFEA